MVSTLALVAAALACTATSATAAASNATGKYAAKFAELANQTAEVKAIGVESIESKLNHTLIMADKVFDFKNITKAGVLGFNLSKFEGVVDGKVDDIVAALNATAGVVAGLTEGVEAKIEEPVKVVDAKVDALKAEVEAKLAVLKNKTVDIKALEFP